jgi:hypothetical protein
MRGGGVPLALLFLALGLAFAFSPRRAWGTGLLALLATLAAGAFVRLPQAWLEGVFFAFWVSVILTAASVHLGRELKPWAAVALSFNAAVWASAVVSLSGSMFDLLEALPSVLIVLPATWVVSRCVVIPVKVISSWVIAIRDSGGHAAITPCHSRLPAGSSGVSV